MIFRGLARAEWCAIPEHDHMPVAEKPAETALVVISPGMIVSTTMSRSYRRNQSTTAASGSGLVGSLRTLASTRYFTAYWWIQMRGARSSPFQDRRAAK